MANQNVRYQELQTCHQKIIRIVGGFHLDPTPDEQSVDVIHGQGFTAKYEAGGQFSVTMENDYGDLLDVQLGLYQERADTVAGEVAHDLRVTSIEKNAGIVTVHIGHMVADDDVLAAAYANAVQWVKFSIDFDASAFFDTAGNGNVGSTQRTFYRSQQGLIRDMIMIPGCFEVKGENDIELIAGKNVQAEYGGVGEYIIRLKNQLIDDVNHIVAVQLTHEVAIEKEVANENMHCLRVVSNTSVQGTSHIVTIHHTVCNDTDNASRAAALADTPGKIHFVLYASPKADY
jgi:hypothetical protein